MLWTFGGALHRPDVGRLLGHNSRWETEAFLHEKQAYLHYSEEDLTRDMEKITSGQSPDGSCRNAIGQ